MYQVVGSNVEVKTLLDKHTLKQTLLPKKGEQTMKEFMLYIRNSADAKAALSADEHVAFVKNAKTISEN